MRVLADRSTRAASHHPMLPPTRFTRNVAKCLRASDLLDMPMPDLLKIKHAQTKCIAKLAKANTELASRVLLLDAARKLVSMKEAK